MRNKFIPTGKGWLGLAFAALLTGCGEASYSPEPIDEAVDVCAECNMSVEDNPFAAELINEKGHVLKFDDIGCLAQYLTHSESESAKAYVRDFESMEWLALEESHFSHTDELQTPMNYGFVAFKNEEQRNAFAKPQNPLDWEELQKLAKQKKGMMMP